MCVLPKFEFISKCFQDFYCVPVEYLSVFSSVDLGKRYVLKRKMKDKWLQRGVNTIYAILIFHFAIAHFVCWV